MVPIKKRASSFPLLCHPAYPSFHLHFLKFLVSRTISGVDLREMTLKGGIVYSVLSTVTFQAFRRLTIMCVQLANVYEPF